MVKRAQFDMARSSTDDPPAVAESNFFALEILSKAPGLSQPIMAGAAHLQIPISRPVSRNS